MPYMKGALMYECVFDNFPNRVWIEQNNKASLPPQTTQDRVYGPVLTSIVQNGLIGSLCTI
jgi:hypothetical protein